jgi:hypothetical protein
MCSNHLFGLFAIGTLLLVHPSVAHDAWINENGLRNPATQEWCCGRGDCGIVIPTPRATVAGWVIHGEEIIDINGRRIRVDEVVPYNEVLPSPDGYFWRCHTVESKNYDVHGHAGDYVDGERRCFFAPPQTL